MVSWPALHYGQFTTSHASVALLSDTYLDNRGHFTTSYQISNIGNKLTLGTICHENGHIMGGWPDLYDFDYSTPGVGKFCLMAYGGQDINPAEPCAPLKYANGWCNVIPGGETISLRAGVNDVCTVAKSGNPKEFFIVENRQQSGRDASLPDSGLAIWHVDYNITTGNDKEGFTPSTHFMVSLEQADGRFDLEQNFNWGDSADLYDASTPGFTFNTNPDNKWWDGTASDFQVTNISTPGSVMTLRTVPGMEVLPVEGLIGTGTIGTPFTPVSMSYTLNNTGVISLSWVATKTQSWVTLSKAGGILAAGASDTVTVTINAGAGDLAPGLYADTVTITNLTNGSGNTTRAVSLMVKDSAAWIPATVAAPWSARAGHASVVLNNKLWVLGSGGNDVWSSDDGVNWTQVTAAAPWRARTFHNVVALGGKMYLMGGRESGWYPQADVWCSSDGAAWTQLTGSVPWGPRVDMGVAVMNNKIWLAGGRDAYGKIYNDVWSSSDGANWTRVTTTAPWEARASLRMEALGGKLYLLGGFGGTSEVFLNDVWSSSDGVNWTRTTASAPWEARQNLASAVIDNKLWILGGWGSVNYLKDVWSSSDGANWSLSMSTVPWSARAFHTAESFLNRLYILGGSNKSALYYNDVWYLPVTPVMSVTPAAGLTASGAVGGPFSPASATYTVTNTGGSMLVWTAGKTQSWVSVSPASGSLAAGASATVTISLNSGANSLGAGTQTDTVTFTNATSGIGNTTRAVTVTITEPTSTFGLSSGNEVWREPPGYLEVMRFQNTAGSGLLTQLELLFDSSNTPSGKVRLGVYADNNGVPGNRLLDAGEVAAGSGWVAISGLNLPVTQGTHYWLAFNLQSTTDPQGKNLPLVVI